MGLKTCEVEAENWVGWKRRGGFLCGGIDGSRWHYIVLAVLVVERMDVAVSMSHFL